MAPDSGPDGRLPEHMPRPRLVPLFAALLVMAATLVSAATRNVIREDPTPPPGVSVTSQGVWLMPCKATPRTMRCPRGVECSYAIHDGPDGFPSSIIRPECFDELIQDGTLEESVRSLASTEQVIDMHCQTSLEECIAKKDAFCAGVKPQQGMAVQMAKVTKFEIGKACQFTCADGVERECVLVPTRPKPQPSDTAFTPQ